MFYTKIFSTLFILFSVTSAHGSSIRISQIDTHRLLIDQQIHLYLSVTDNLGKPIEKIPQDRFEVSESPNGTDFHIVDQINHFQEGSDIENGVNFMLMLDNSGSMYRTISGESTKEDHLRRTYFAQNAIQSFLKSISNPNDKVGLAAYNSFYTTLSKPVGNKLEVSELLNKIERPDPKGDAVYTEIYGSLKLAVNELKTMRGRKAIIILSDGENSPYYTNTKKEHPIFGNKIIRYKEPLELLQREGISVYVIHFGQKSGIKDQNLPIIARESGGITFDAYDPEKLLTVYHTIMDQVLKEYQLSYSATMSPAERKYVKIRLPGDKQIVSKPRFYFSSTLLGSPENEINPLIFIALILGAGILFLLSKMRFERQRLQPTIEILNQGNADVSTKIITLGGDETIIGSSNSAAMTIAGTPSMEENHATIAFDSKKEIYTIIGKTGLLVNNQKVTKKKLESGDLINMDGVTLVFNDGKS